MNFWSYSIIALCFTVGWPQSDREIEHQTHVAGVSTNIGIQCPIPQSDGAVDSDIFWIINGSVYGLLQVPAEFRVCTDACDLDSLRIPLVLGEMDGYTFQCVRVNYGNHTVQFLRDAAVLEVVEPPDSIRNDILQGAVTRDLLELSYPQSSVGAVNTTIGLTYSSLTCHPSVFTIQGYADRDAIQQDTPTLTLTSSSSVLTFPTNITNGSLYWRLLAHEEAGTPCTQDSALKYYQLDITNGTYNFTTVSPSSDGVGCVSIPVGPSPDYSSLEVVWPERRDTVGRLCYCPPFEGEQHLFSRCISTTSCDTDYSITVSNGSVCFGGLSPPLTSIPVYFTLLESCFDGGCVIRSVLASSVIRLSMNSPIATPSSTRDVTVWTQLQFSNLSDMTDSSTGEISDTNTNESEVPTKAFPYFLVVATLVGSLFLLLLLSFLFLVACCCLRKKKRDCINSITIQQPQQGHDSHPPSKHTSYGDPDDLEAHQYADIQELQAKINCSHYDSIIADYTFTQCPAYAAPERDLCVNTQPGAVEEPHPPLPLMSDPNLLTHIYEDLQELQHAGHKGH